MGLFNSYIKEGPGVPKNAPKKKHFFAFFDIYFGKFWQLIELGMFYFLCCLPIVTIGAATAGFTYVLRNWAKGTHSFVFSDFFEAVKKNWKQATVIWFMQLFLMLCLVFGITQYSPNRTFFVIYFCVAIAVNILFLFMSFYIYPMLVTFKFNIRQLIKNAFLFSSIGLKTNLITLFWIILLIGAPMILVYYFPYAIVIYPVFVISTVGLIINYNVYPYLKKYIIDPYYKDHPEELEKTEDNEKVFSDNMEDTEKGE